MLSRDIDDTSLDGLVDDLVAARGLRELREVLSELGIEPTGARTDAVNRLKEHLKQNFNQLETLLADVLGGRVIRSILEDRTIDHGQASSPQELAVTWLRARGIRPVPAARPRHLFRDISEILSQAQVEGDGFPVSKIVEPELRRFLRFMAWFYLHACSEKVRAELLLDVGADSGSTMEESLELLDCGELAKLLHRLPRVRANPFSIGEGVPMRVLDDSEYLRLSNVATAFHSNNELTFKLIAADLFAIWRNHGQDNPHGLPPPKIPRGAVCVSLGQVGQARTIALVDESGQSLDIEIQGGASPPEAIESSTLLCSLARRSYTSDGQPFLPNSTAWMNSQAFHDEARAFVPEPGARLGRLFLSYHRDQASWAVKAIEERLTERGWDAFIDIKTLRSGQVAPGIEREIRTRANFVIVLADASLDRLTEAGDWVRLELEYALRVGGRSIVPVLVDMDVATFQRRVTEGLSDIPSIVHLTTLNTVTIVSDHTFGASIERLIGFLRPIT